MSDDRELDHLRRRVGLPTSAERSHAPDRVGPGKLSGTEPSAGYTAIAKPGARTLVEQIDPLGPSVGELADSIDGNLEIARQSLVVIESKDDTSGRAVYKLCGALGALRRAFAAARKQRDARALAKHAAYADLRSRAAAHVPGLDASDSAEARVDANSVHVAQRAFEGDGQPLPHADKIQAAFGRHDISSIRVNVGGNAAEANHRLGSRAFASNGRIAFASPPDLELAAHEAAHVVQQRSGVALKGELDEPGDEYEQHADAVAEGVSRGESVEPLLDVMAGKGASASPATSVVQRKADGNSSPKQHDPFELHMSRYEPQLRDVITAHLQDAVWPDPAPDVPWLPGGNRLFSRSLAAEIVKQLRDPVGFRRYVHPGDPRELFDKYVRWWEVWFPDFGLNLAAQVERAVMASLTRRMGPQYRAHLASRVEPPTATDLTPLHPIDPFVIRAMMQPRVLDNRNVATTDKPAESVSVEVEWLGSLEPELWNFVRVSPSSAPFVDVAKAIFGPDKTTNAYAIEKVGEYYRVAPAHARSAIKSHFPGRVIGADASASSQLVTLANSRFGRGDAAPRQFDDGSKQAPRAAPKRGSKKKGGAAERHAPTAGQLQEVERAIGQLLNSISAQVNPFGLSSILSTAYDARLERRERLANADDAARERWVPVLQFQHAQLMSIAPKIGPLIHQLKPLMLPDMVMSPKKMRTRERVMGTLQKWVEAAAVSHFRDQSLAIMRTLVRKEHEDEDEQDIAAIANVRGASEEAIGSGERSMKGSATADEPIVAYRRAKLLGLPKGNSEYERKKAFTAAGSMALANRMIAARRALGQLQAAADAAGFADPATFRQMFPSLKMKTVPELVTDVRGRLDEVDRIWDKAIEKGTPLVQTDPTAPDDAAEWQGAAVGLAAAQQAFAKIAGDQSLGEFVRKMQSEIRHQAFINALTSLATSLLLTVALGMGAAAVASRVAGALVGEATTLARAAIKGAVDISINATLNSTVQLAMAGGKGSPGWMVLENALMELFTRGMMAPLQRMNKAALDEARAISKMEHLTKAERSALASVNFAGTEFAVQVFGGAATMWAANRLTQMGKKHFHTRNEKQEEEDRNAGIIRSADDEISEPFAMTLLQQGAAIGLGKFFHGQLRAWRKHRFQLSATDFGSIPEARALFDAREQFYADAQKLAESVSPDPSAGNQLTERNVELIKQERALLETRRGNDIDRELPHADTPPPHQAEPAVAPDPATAGQHGEAAHAKSSKAEAHEPTREQAQRASSSHGVVPATTKDIRPSAQPENLADVPQLAAILSELRPVIRGKVYEGTEAQISAVLSRADELGLSLKSQRDAETGVLHIEAGHRRIDLIVEGGTEVYRKKHVDDREHEYDHDALRPGPLGDRSVYDPHGTGAMLPAQGFYGGKYDAVTLNEDTLLYRVGNAEREWGEWFTDTPLQSEANYRIDVAVKREWSHPATNELPEGSARSAKQLELWCYTVSVPKGTTVYIGPVATQGGVFMGGLGAGQKQYFIPKAWTLAGKGGRVVAKAPFKRDGHIQPAPVQTDGAPRSER